MTSTVLNNLLGGSSNKDRRRLRNVNWKSPFVSIPQCEFPLNFTKAVGEKIQSDFKCGRLNDYKLSVHEVRGVGDRQVDYEVLCETGTSQRRLDFIPNCSDRHCFVLQFSATARQTAVCLPLVRSTA